MDIRLKIFTAFIKCIDVCMYYGSLLLPCVSWELMSCDPYFHAILPWQSSTQFYEHLTYHFIFSNVLFPLVLFKIILNSIPRAICISFQTKL